MNNQVPLSYFAPDDKREATPTPGEPATRAELEMYAIPLYVRLQIPLRYGQDFDMATIPKFRQFATTLRELANRLDQLSTETRSTDIHRLHMLRNAVNHANADMRLDSTRKQRHTKSSGSV